MGFPDVIKDCAAARVICLRVKMEISARVSLEEINRKAPLMGAALTVHGLSRYVKVIE